MINAAKTIALLTQNKKRRIKNMKERLAKLLSVKSIVTIILTGVFAYLAIIGKVSGEQFIGIFTMVIGFYFGTQAMKEGGDKK